MDATIMKEIDYRDASAVLARALGLKNSPVAVRLAMYKR